MDFTLTEKFTRDEKKTICTAFFVWENEDPSGFSAAVKRDVKNGIPSARRKVMSDARTFSYAEYAAIEYTIICLYDWFLHPPEEFDPADREQNLDMYLSLIRSVARKIRCDFDFDSIH